MPQIPSFGELVRERRLAKAESDPTFSLRQLADRVGIEPSNPSKIERAEQPPPGEQNIRRLVAKQMSAIEAEIATLTGEADRLAAEISELTASDMPG
jgi:transcriptional regulator with XRE-family HTH domain